MQDRNHADVKERLIFVAKRLNVRGVRGLAKKLGEEESRLYAWIRNGNIVDTGIILSKCPEINLEWLKSGKGEPLNNKFKEFSKTRQGDYPEKTKWKKAIPVRTHTAETICWTK